MNSPKPVMKPVELSITLRALQGLDRTVRGVLAAPGGFFDDDPIAEVNIYGFVVVKTKGGRQMAAPVTNRDDITPEMVSILLTMILAENGYRAAQDIKDKPTPDVKPTPAGNKEGTNPYVN